MPKRTKQEQLRRPRGGKRQVPPPPLGEIAAIGGLVSAGALPALLPLAARLAPLAPLATQQAPKVSKAIRRPPSSPETVKAVDKLLELAKAKSNLVRLPTERLLRTPPAPGRGARVLKFPEGEALRERQFRLVEREIELWKAKLEKNLGKVTRELDEMVRDVRRRHPDLDVQEALTGRASLKLVELEPVRQQALHWKQLLLRASPLLGLPIPLLVKRLLSSEEKPARARTGFAPRGERMER